MIESMIAGAVAIVGITTLLLQFGDANVNTIVNTRRSTAAQLAKERIEEMRVIGFTSAASESATSVSGVKGTYTRTTTVGTSATEVVGTSGVNNITLTYKTVQVDLTFESVPGTIETISLKDRLYQ